MLSIFLFTVPGFAFWWGWGSLSLLLIAYFITSETKLNITPFFIAVLLYAISMLFNIFFINPAFHPEAVYFIAFLFVSFMFGRNLNLFQSNQLSKIILLIFCVLSLWGIYQYLTGMGYIKNMGNRANSIFATPNTFAAAINLFLIPLIIYRLYFTDKIKLDIPILLLHVCLTAHQNRPYSVFQK